LKFAYKKRARKKPKENRKKRKRKRKVIKDIGSSILDRQHNKKEKKSEDEEKKKSRITASNASDVAYNTHHIEVAGAVAGAADFE
jgi:hypothetical protein